MGQFTTALITCGTILAVILATDSGNRRITAVRIAGPTLVAVIVTGACIHSFPTAGNDTSLHLAAIGVGVICGLVASSPLTAHRDPAGDIRTTGGSGQAAVWVCLSGAQILFAYGCEHWFGARIDRFTTDYQLSGSEVLVSSLALMSLSMVTARAAVLLSRQRAVRTATITR
ncbi:hypothetical protein Snoj_16850 [Streptomyces nojiriensis]|uniref:Integral membrane protein n=1 Tax=Streptomyces nojiriensis TaxID=66374 RepID=A0ABQ3SHZ6_9ACTN|nr:hypothetical protein [Streptomyces nojiriensis]QTI49388.1 hypothetical protein JYK04_07260 [Streptomyces nojiriensis]GGS36616.1 hypothetical protein GCM10010205_78340 [Streptomyces nojiriensis]GHI67767.1 hypothetical protein Snoj_16850 [Streptomyces nojiriensis]